MSAEGWFEDLPVLGKLPRELAVTKLRELGEDDVAEALEAAEETSRKGGPTFGGRWSFWSAQNEAWQHTAHTFGYLAPSPPGSGPLPIQHAGNIAADTSLRNSRIKISLDRLRVADYPGSGTHRVLFDFYAQNQLPGNVEHLHFNATYRVREGEQAAIVGYPIFVGLNVGSEGLSFKCYTVNVQNDEDEAFLGFLESDVFKAGLKLAATAQLAIAPFSDMAMALTRRIATRNRNVPVQDFYLGLDFSDIPMRARLATGSYLAVQIPETFQTIWSWSDWVYDPSNGQVVSRADPDQLIPYNYVVFGVSPYDDGTA